MKKKNARTADKKRKMSISNSIVNEESVLNVIDTADVESDVQFLKFAVVDKTIPPEFEAKLQATLSYRWEMMKTPELDLKETFPYFFTSPSLVGKNLFILSSTSNDLIPGFARFRIALQGSRLQCFLGLLART